VAATFDIDGAPQGMRTNPSRLPCLPRPDVYREEVSEQVAVVESERRSPSQVYLRCRLDLTSVKAFHAFDLTAVAAWQVLRSGASDGTLQVFTSHTTCAMVINEWESGLLVDLEAALERVASSLDQHFWHDDPRVRYENLEDDEPANGHAHVWSMLLGGPSRSVQIGNGELQLGKWQRIILLELDRPRQREVRLQVEGWR
jgi:secondary thiamine-phosphate synthase enzyme